MQTNPQVVHQVMTRSPRAFAPSTTVRAAAEEMKRSSIGAVMVERDGQLCGIVTDRDIVVRCVAEGGDCDQTPLATVCSPELLTLSPQDTVDAAVEMMRSNAVRRIPVVENGRAVGIISLGDLAQARDPNSALGGISAALPTR